MSHVLTLIAAPASGRLTAATVDGLREQARADHIRLGAPEWLAMDEACDLPIAGDHRAVAAWAARHLAGRKMDYGVIATHHRRKRFLIADMDATIVVGETLDELAARAGVGDAVAAVTAKAMRGELDFKQALRDRVAALAGLDADAIDDVIGALRLSPGADVLIRTLDAAGVATMLVSGGFTQFVAHVADRLGFRQWQANTLEIVDGRLTGKVVEPVLDKDAKLMALRNLAAGLEVDASDGLAVGDGANDLPMIEAAGIGVAWRGKPVLRAGADACVDHADLTALLYFQGYRRDEFAPAPRR